MAVGVVRAVLRPKVKLVLYALSLLARHELLSVLIWIGELTAALLIEVLLRTAISVR